MFFMAHKDSMVKQEEQRKEEKGEKGGVEGEQK